MSIAGGVLPCVIEVVGPTVSVAGTPNIVLHAFTNQAGTTNVSTFSELILQGALNTALPGTSTSDFFTSPTATLAAPSALLTAAATALNTVKTTYGLSSDPVTTAFSANSTGIDAVLDANKPIKVTVTVAGASGSVVSNPAGINCSSGTCAAAFAPGTQVTLTATPGSSLIGFQNWTGGTAGLASCSSSTATACGPLALSADSTVTANFAALSVATLNVSVAGGGTVSSTVGSPGAISCTSATSGYTGSCSQVFGVGTTVTLQASGAGFVGWAGPGVVAGTTGCSGTGTCTFTKTASTQYVTAIFASGGASPVQLYTDILSGPTSGGENNKGIYLSVFGKGFGTTGLGTTAKVYLDNIEVDNYKVLATSRGRADVQQITAQLGSLGGAANGSNLPVQVVINGNKATDPNTLSFKVNPGKIYFVSLSGSDTTGQPDSIANPYRSVQKQWNNAGNTAGCPIAAGDMSVASSGVWGLIRPGDFIVMRGGTWTDSETSNLASTSFLVVQNRSGSAPTGAVNTGPITLMGYPGETAYIDKSNNVPTGTLAGVPGSAISAADTARQQIGCGAWVVVTNLKIESGYNDGMVTTQAGYLNASGGSNWRVVNNELTATSAINNNHSNGAGVTGSGNGVVILGNQIHDVNGGQNDIVAGLPNSATTMQHHGVYIDGTGSYEVAYNWIHHIYGGNGVQTYSSSGTNITNAKIHHNIIHDVYKFGINISAQSTTGFEIYNNVVYNISYSGLAFQASSAPNNLVGAKVYNNTIYNVVIGPFHVNVGGLANHGGIYNNGVLASNALDFRNNLIVPVGKPYYNGGSFTGTGTFTNNLFFNGTGTNPTTTFSSTSSLSVDPLFVSTTSGSENLALQAASPAVNAGSSAVSGTVVNDVLFVTRPQGAAYDIGAYEQ